MIINQQTIENWSPNAAAFKNGKELVSKFTNLKKDKEQTLLWGECQGSGKNPYYTSVDFINENPTFRCTCPSRQFPCKHALGLLFAYAEGKYFEENEIPEDIKSKRSKIENRKEKKETDIESIKEIGAKPKKTNTSALIKKIDQQVTGISNAQKLLQNIVSIGLASLDAKEKSNIAQQIKDLGNYPISGIQNSFNKLLLELNLVENENFVPVIDHVNFLSTLIKKSLDYLQTKKDNPEMQPDIDSCIEEQIGTIWKLTDLVALNLYNENVELVQLSFEEIDDEARKEIIETGIWIELSTGKIYKTQKYRPYKALKYIKEENSINGLCKVNGLYIYPGDANPRIRWENNDLKQANLHDQHLQCIIDFAETDYKKAITAAKGYMKNPLMTKNPIFLISLHKAMIIADDLVLEDQNGQLLTLKNLDLSYTATFLKFILPAQLTNSALLVSFENDLVNGFLSAKPISLVTPTKIIKLLF